MYRAFCAAFLAGYIITNTALCNTAQAPQLNKHQIGNVGKWRAFKAESASKNICYAVLPSTQRIGNYDANLPKPYFMLHYMPNKKFRIAFYLGYKPRHDAAIYITVNSNHYVLDAQNTYAVTHDTGLDTKIASDMSKSEKLFIRAEGGDSDGYTVDTYTLTNIDAVIGILQKNCTSQNTSH